MSPTVLRDGPFRLFFFSREEPRPHVHVAHPDGEAKFWIDPDVELAAVVGLPRGSWRTPNPSSAFMSRRSVMPGRATSVAEVTHVSRHGFWLLLGDEELPVPFAEFPWFRQATIEQLTHVEWPTPDHLYWPQLDVDLAVRSLRDPAAFPVVARVARVAAGGSGGASGA